MNILVATPMQAPSMGGPATFLEFIKGNLVKDFFIDVVSFDVYLKYPKILRHLIYSYKLCLKVKNKDYILVLDTFSVAFPVLMCAIIFNKKIILRVPGDFAWEQFVNQYKSDVMLDNFNDLRKIPLKIKFYKFIQIAIAKRSIKIIVPSNYLKQVVVNWEINKNKIFVVHNSFEGVKDIKYEKLNLKKINQEKILFSAGRLVHWKGFSELIDLTINLKSEFKLYIAGDGPDKEKLENKIKNLKLNGRVFLLGNLSKDELAKYIVSSDYFILNTGYEGMSHQLLEVMSLGVPIITTNVPGNLEIIEDKKNGFLFNYNDIDQLKKIIENTTQDELNHVVIEGLKFVDNFKKVKIADELNNILKNI